MRRSLFLGIGVIETVLACVLVIIGWQIPRPSAADQCFDRADQITRSAAEQVHLFRGQIGEIRQKDFPKMARQLRIRAETVVGNFRTASIDFATVEAISAALATSSRDLESWSDALNAEKYLAVLADLNDEVNRPSSQRLAEPAAGPASPVAGDIDRGLFGLWRGPELASKATNASPRDLDDKQRLEGPKCVEGLVAIRGRCAELEQNLDSTIRHVQILSSINLPFVALGGAPTGIEMRPLWPEGRIIAMELQKSLDVLKAFNQQLNSIASAAPEMFKALAGPNHPNGETGKSMGASSDRFRELTAELRKNSRELQQIRRTWPALVETMRSSARALKSSQRQLDAVLAQRAFCERAVNDSGRITGAAEDLFDSCSAQFEARLDEQEKALGQMEKGLNDVADTLPPVKQTANDVLVALRWMFWLVAGFIGLHGAFVACDACLKR
jgi:hypothetical protein